MKVLLCHNYYQRPGGEDQVFADDARLLESHGHDVLRFTVHNDRIASMSSWRAALAAVWNHESYRAIRDLIRRERPDVLHCHNTFPLLSPAAYYAARAEDVKVVQTVHNYRLACVNAMLLRDGRPCEECLRRCLAWPGVKHACYRGSRKASVATAGMLAMHRMLGTWSRAVDVYCALTAFARNKLIEAGMPAEKIVIKPNAVLPDPQPGSGRGGYAIFVGRLSEEKGIETLLGAWARHTTPTRLLIVGDGPLNGRVRQAAADDPRITWLGWRDPREVLESLGEAAFLVLPSVWYEGLPKTLLEALAKGTPVIASRIGALAELLEEGHSGLYFRPGDAADLAATVRRLSDEPEHLPAMRQPARKAYLERYCPEQGYRALMAVYSRALGRPPEDDEQAAEQDERKAAGESIMAETARRD